MSTHAVKIIEIDVVEPHPNPVVERMEITRIGGVNGWQCCIGKGQFKVGDKAIYCEPDYLVPLTHPLFAFLKKAGDAPDKTHERITARKFKAAYSFGLLVTVPPELQDKPVGTNVMDDLRILRYEQPIPNENFEGGPSGLYTPKFDVESLQNHGSVLQDGEEVIATEKIHGQSARYTFMKNKDGVWKQFCGTRVNWMADGDNDFWNAFRGNPAIGDFCRAHPGVILYGETFGNVRNFKYGSQNGERFFAVFAILDKMRWLDFDEAQKMIEPFPGLPWTPIAYRGPFDFKKLQEIALADSRWYGANHMSEGLVIIPVKERMNESIGRVMLKLISSRYWEKGA
jgi:RNA ligase (TIGR02306 family)